MKVGSESRIEREGKRETGMEERRRELVNVVLQWVTKTNSWKYCVAIGGLLVCDGWC